MESLHRYLAFAMILCSITLLVKFEVMLHWKAGISSFLVLSRGYGRGKIPKCCENRNAGEYGKENPGENPPIHLACQIGRAQSQQSAKEDVGEIVTAGRVGR